MIRLIITADDELYNRLSCSEPGADCVHIRAMDVLDGFRQATQHPVDAIIVDMSLHAADTLIETLHHRPVTAHIPLYIVQSNSRIPFELRRLCTDVLEANTL